MAVATTTGEILFFETRTWRKIGEVDGHYEWAYMQRLPQHLMSIAGSSHNQIRRYDLHTLEMVDCYVHEGVSTIFCMRSLPDGRIASSGDDTAIKELLVAQWESHQQLGGMVWLNMAAGQRSRL